MSASPDEGTPAHDVGASKAGEPEWTSSLKKLYDSVVDEPLPDTFKDLLSQLDNDDSQ